MSVVTKKNNPELYNALFPEDEIKEIDITKDLYLCSPLLNKDCSKENCYINNGCCCHTVNKKHSQQHLLDYITNLQEEKERLKELCDKYEEEHNTAFKLWKGKLKETMDETLIQKQHDRIKELEAINEEHRKLNGNLRTANNTLCEVEDFMYNQAKDYKTRNEKAIEYFEEMLKYYNGFDDEKSIYQYLRKDTIKEVLNILQGEQNE